MDFDFIKPGGALDKYASLLATGQVKNPTKPKINAAHPDPLLNWLVSTSLEKRELFFLQCFLNELDSKIIYNEDLSECIERYNNDHGHIMNILWGLPKESLGIRGRVYEFIVECQWDLEDYIYDRKKEYHIPYE